MTFADQDENANEEVQDENATEEAQDENATEEAQDEMPETDSEADDESSDEESSDSDKAEEQPESCGDGCGCSDSAGTDTSADENTETDIAADADAEIDAAAAAADFPVASLEMLLMTHHTQAVMALGMMPDPMTGETSANKDAAKFHIDMLSVIEEKTKGNLTDEESEALNSILHQLRMAFFAS
jgi:cytoskeletal protein RodZ